MAVQLADALRSGQEAAAERERLQLQVSEVAEELQQQVGETRLHALPSISNPDAPSYSTKPQIDTEVCLYVPRALLGPFPDGRGGAHQGPGSGGCQQGGAGGDSAQGC